jgi:hypothetical protein
MGESFCYIEKVILYKPVAPETFLVPVRNTRIDRETEFITIPSVSHRSFPILSQVSLAARNRTCFNYDLEF